MFPYDLPFLPGSRPPERWDVVVFRYPEEPEVSYIKRLVGLAWRDDPDLPRRCLRQECGERHVHAGPQTATPSIGDPDHRLRRSASATAPWRKDRVAAVAERGRRLEDRRSRRQSVSDRRSPEGRVGRVALPPSRARSRAMGSHRNDRTLPRQPRADADHRLLLVQHQHVGGFLPTCSTTSSGTRKRMDAAALGRRSDSGGESRGHELAPDASVRLELVKAGARPSLHDRPGDRDRRRDSGRR